MDVKVWIEIAGKLIPVITTTYEQFRKIFAEQDVPPEVYATIDADYERRKAQAQQEADSHGAPAPPTAAG